MYQSQERPFTMLKAQDTWERQGVTINQTAGAYSIWEPDKDENGEVIYLENSREPAGYHYKYMYDVNDTNYSYQPVSPTSEQALESLLTRNEIPISVVDEIKNVITIEDGTTINGLSTTIKELIVNENLKNIKINTYAYPDKFIQHGTVEELEKIYHQDAESIYKDIMTIVDKKRQENETM